MVGLGLGFQPRQPGSRDYIFSRSVRLHPRLLPPRDLLFIILGFSLFSPGIKKNSSSGFSHTLDFVQTEVRIEEYV